MLTTADSFHDTAAWEDPRPANLDATNASSPDAEGVSKLGVGLFVLDMLILCLALGQMIIWSVTLASVDPPQVFMSVCDAVFGLVIVAQRVPAYLLLH